MSSPMLEYEKLSQICEDQIKAALVAGADAVDAYAISSTMTEIGVRKGALENVDRSEGAQVGLRVFIGKRNAIVSASAEHADDLAKRAYAMAKWTPPDEYAGLADPEQLWQGKADDDALLELDDGLNIETKILKDSALEMENAALENPAITNSNGAGVSASQSHIALATSTGFNAAYSRSNYAAGISVIAQSENGMETDYAQRQFRHFSDHTAFADIGEEAARRTVERLNPVNFDDGNIPVMFDPRIGSSFLGHLISAISGSAITRKGSFLLDKKGQKVFNKSINIIDCPHRKRGLGSRLFDGEGLATAKTKIIEDGILGGWLLEGASARQLGLTPTGHASRGAASPPGVSTSNLHMCAGTMSPESLMANVKHGVYITGLIGQGVNLITGEYSRGATGRLIRNGELSGAINEFTIAGNLIDIYASLQCADDLQFIYHNNVPTLYSDAMTVAGG